MVAPIAPDVRLSPPVSRCHQHALDVLSFMSASVIAIIPRPNGCGASPCGSGVAGGAVVTFRAMDRRRLPARPRSRPGRRGRGPRHHRSGEPDRRPPAPAPAAAVTPAGAPRCPVLRPAPPPTGVVEALSRARARRSRSPSTTARTPRSSRAFAAFAADTGVRLTFFPNGCYRSWEDNAHGAAAAGRLGPGGARQPHLVPPRPDHARRPRGGRGDRPQPGLPARHVRRPRQPVLPAAVRRPRRADRPDRRRPRAPDGRHVERHAGGLAGPHCGGAAWPPRTEWFAAQSIIVGHANHATVTTVYDELLELIAERELRTVTLADVWATPPQRLRGRASAKRPGGHG